jgi:iron complex transport system substrate-binding protein
VRKTLCIVALAVVAAACSNTATTTPKAAPSASFPVSIAAANGSITIPKRPARIVSLSPTSTEILFAIGAGSQVVAVDDQSNYPANAPKTKLSGFEPNIEAIASYTPDLVVFSTDVKQLGASLVKLKIPAIQHDAANTLDDTYTQIKQLGAATGHPGEAARLTARMKKDIRDIVAGAPTFSGQLTYYHELDSQFFSTTSKTFIGTIYSLLNLRNIADPADKPDNHYPQLSPEAIIQADPDLIFLADTKCCSQSATTVGKRPGWDKITAVKSGDVIALDDDIASRWGPRVVDFLRTVADALRKLKKAA